MPWFFSIPEFLKKRACRYLLQHYLGQFLEEKINLDDLTVDLYNGSGSIHNIPLNVQAINDALRGVGAPVQVKSGFIDCVTVSVPWAALLKDSCVVELSGLTLTLAPHHMLNMEEYMSMTDSLFFSMTSSKQMAEEVLRTASGEGGGESNQGFEGMEALAQAIELVLARVQVTLKNTIIQVNYEPLDLTQAQRHFLQLQIGSIEFYDEMSKVESSVDVEGAGGASTLANFAVKVVQLSELSVELGRTIVPTNSNLDESAPTPCDGESVPVAVAGGKFSLKVTIKQNESEPGPRLEVDGFLGTLHFLFTPQQIRLFQEMATDIVSQVDTGQTDISELCPGQGRPIPHGDRTTIESQLAQQQEHRSRTKLRERQEDLLDADPWDNLIAQTAPKLPQSHLMTDSTSSSDHFYSLDLNSSLTSSAMSGGMEESFLSTTSQLTPILTHVGMGTGGREGTVHRRSLDRGEAIPLHEGVGLQQLSQSPPFQPSPSMYPKTPKQDHTSCGAKQRPPSPSCKYHFTLSGVTLALLEADPAHTYTTRLTTPMETNGIGPHSSSLDEGGLDPVKYFDLVIELLKDGVNSHQFQLKEKELARILPTDHLLMWLSLVRVSAGVMEDSRWESELTLSTVEVWEYLYGNQTRINSITKPVSVYPILQFHGNQVLTPPKPCLRLKFTSSPDSSHKKSRFGFTRTDVEVALSVVKLGIDPTLLDRLQPLLTRPSQTSKMGSMQSCSSDRVRQSLYMTSSNMQTIQLQRQVVFNQAVAAKPSSHTKTNRMSLRVSGDTVNISLRFPVPEYGKAECPPWFLPSLRSEVFFIELEDWITTCQLHPLALAGEATYTVDSHFSQARAYLSSDGSVSNKEQFLVISKKLKGSLDTSSVDMPTIIMEVQPEPDRSLEQRPTVQPHFISPIDLLEESISGTKAIPQPFSQQRSMFSAGNLPNKDGYSEGAEELHSEEQVLPGTVSEMNEFEQFSSRTSHYYLNCIFPEVRVHLPSKHFLETVYNRFGTDLVMWEPATPIAMSKANAKSVLYSCMDILQPAATSEERFLMCKSVLQEESSDEEGDGFLSEGGGNCEYGESSGAHDERRGLNCLAISLSVERGLISMFPEQPPSSAESSTGHTTSNDSNLISNISLDDSTLIQLSPGDPDVRHTGSEKEKGEKKLGVAIMDIANLHAFYVFGFQGDPTHAYACAWVEAAALYHHGNPQSGTGYSIYSCLDQTFDLSICNQLHPVFGPNANLSQQDLERQPMFAVAMEENLDKEHSTKSSKVAVSIANTVMFYRLTYFGLAPLQQLVNFLDLKEEAVAGYQWPSLVIELHLHFMSCSVEYRPLYLPLVATLVMDSISLSTSIVGGAPVHVVRVVLDGIYLLLTSSHCGKHKKPLGGSHSVCVVEVEWLEATLRLCNNDLLNEELQRLFAKMPDVSLECVSNIVHFRMCVDSCIALRDLLVYFTSRQDLNQLDSTDLKDYSHLPNVTTTATDNPESLPAGSPLTSLDEGHVDIGDLISDAMEDTPPTDELIQGVGVSRRHHDTPQSSHPRKMEVRISGKSLLMDFESDSDVEEDISRRRVGSKKKPLLSSVPGKPSGLEHNSSIFSESDDEFCMVETPTSTKVAPGARPKVKCLLEEGEELEVIDDHFSIPDGQVDQLQRPRFFPEPLTQYTLKEMTIIWHLYGGRDFTEPTKDESTPAGEVLGGMEFRGKEVSRPVPIKTPLASWRECCAYVDGTPRKTGGGPGRDHSLLVEVELDKLRVQQENYPPSCEQVSRLVVLVEDVEVRDRLSKSQINKLLYQYTTESMPKQSHASMVMLKVLFTHPELRLEENVEEASVHLSILPVRLNMDQDTVLFLYNFVKQVLDISHLPVSDLKGVTQRVTTAHDALSSSGSVSSSLAHRVFIRSFVFQPDLPIRIDYEAKGFKTEMGTLAGILLGLSHLNNSEVILKALHYKKGLLGWEKLLEYCSNEWVTDIRSYQLPLILKGVGPVHNVSQLVYGLMDFIRLPYQQYQEDGRLVWGFQRGASALTSSTGVAVVELTSQLLETVQVLAQMAYDMVAPGERSSQALVHQHKPYQPLDFREGFSNAYDVVYAGVGGTAVDLYDVASKEHHERGMAGAVGGVLRHLPGTFVKPIILASEATRQVLGGVKNQFVPDARREAHEKWKSNKRMEVKK